MRGVMRWFVYTERKFRVGSSQFTVKRCDREKMNNQYRILNFESWNRNILLLRNS